MAITEPATGGRVVQGGVGAVQVALNEAVNPGDLLGVSSNQWKLADGNNTIYAELVAGQKGASGDTITAYRAARISAYTGATVGVALYLSDTAGAVSESAGTVGQVVGITLSATEILLAPRYQMGGGLIPGAVKQFFRDSGLYIQSNADGKLKISADGSGADDITLDGTITINDDITMAAAKGFATDVKQATGKVIAQGANNFPELTVTDITTAGAATWTAAQMIGGVITRDPNGAARTDTTPTAAQIVAAIPGAKVGTSFLLWVKNTADGAEVLTVAGGTGVTASGDMDIGQNEGKLFICRLTNVTAASEAATLYGLGAVAHNT